MDTLDLETRLRDKDLTDGSSQSRPPTDPSPGSHPVMSRRLDDRIRELTSQVLAAIRPNEQNENLRHLRALILIYIKRLRKQGSQRPIPPERRG